MSPEIGAQKNGGLYGRTLETPPWTTVKHNGVLGAIASPLAADLPCPPLAALPPVRRVPPCARPSLPPAAAAFLKPPFARLPPVRAALPRRYADPRSAALRSGIAAPAGGHGPAAGAAVRGLGRGRLSSPLARLRVELARGALARLRLAPTLFEVGTRRPRGPVPFGQSGPREDRRGSSRRSAALSWPPAAAPPCGLRVGARAGMRYAAARREPNPASDPRSGYALAYARRSNPPRRRISNAACPSAPSKAIFWSKSVAFGPMEAPATQFCPKNGLRRRCKAACNSPRASRYA